MGLFDPIYKALTFFNDILATVVPDWACIFVWAIVSGSAAMGVYRLLSNQTRIRDTKRQLREIKAMLKNSDDASGRDVMALAGRNLRISFGLLGQVILPTMASGIPVLVVAWWLSSTYGYQYPKAGELVRVWAEPQGGELRIEPSSAQMVKGGEIYVSWDPSASSIEILIAGTHVYSLNPVRPAVREVQKFEVWNEFLAEAQGYLPDNSLVSKLQFDVAYRSLFPALPWYLATWESTFFFVLVVWSLLLKFGLRIE